MARRKKQPHDWSHLTPKMGATPRKLTPSERGKLGAAARVRSPALPQVAVKIPQEWIDQLDAIAEASATDRSAVIRRAIAAHINRHPQGGK